MKAFIGLLLISAGMVLSQECGLFVDKVAHPSDCTKYYTFNLQTCPDGLYYSSPIKECVPPEQSQCGQVPTEPPPPTEFPPTTEPSYETTTEVPTLWDTTTQIWEHTTTTSEPPLETTGTPGEPTYPTEPPPPTEPPLTTINIPTSTWIEPTTLEPTTQEPTTLEPTAEPTTPEPTTLEPTEPPTRYPCPAVDDPNNRVRYPHETNCGLYYLCIAGKATTYSCGSNHFNPIKKTCNAVNVAGCDRCPDVEVSGETVRLPHETNCKYYYRCSGGNPSLYTCTGEFFFSRSDRICTTHSLAWCSTVGSL